MQEYEILGIEQVNYTNKAGRLINGVKLHLSYLKDNCDGLCVESVFVKPDIVIGINVGMSVRLLYNKYGNVVQIVIIE